MVIHFLAKFNLTVRERLFMVIFQFDVVYCWRNKLPQKSMNKKSSPFVAQASVLSFISQKMALATLQG
jgi:hypothetical protein